jgi:hypothetical protein
VPAVSLARQCEIFSIALDMAETQTTLINLLIEVHEDGTAETRNWAKDLGG